MSAKLLEREVTPMSQRDSDILVILESGAEWPGHYAGAVPTTGEARAITQYGDESLSEFGERVAEQIARLDGDGNLPSRVIVACSDRTDEGAVRWRRKLGRVVLSTFAHLGNGSLLFSESQRKSGASRQALSALATDLEHEFEDEPVHVSVRFGHPSRSPAESVVP